MSDLKSECVSDVVIYSVGIIQLVNKEGHDISMAGVRVRSNRL